MPSEAGKYHSHRSHGHGSSSWKRDKSWRRERRKRPYTYENFWFCCNCELLGPGPLPLWIDHCPQCCMLRCKTCIVERVKGYVDRGFGSSTGSAKSFNPIFLTLGIPPTSHSSNPLPAAHTITEGKAAHLNSRSNALTSTSVEFTGKESQIDVPSAGVTSPCLDPQLLLVKDPQWSGPMIAGQLDLAQNFSPSASSSPRSSNSSSFLTKGTEFSDSDTDEDVESSSWFSDDAELDSEDPDESIILQNLNLCITTAFRNNLDLAAALIPQVHAIVGNWTRNGCILTTAAPGGGGNAAAGYWSRTGGDGSSGRNPAASSNGGGLTSGGTGPFSGQLGKRSREPSDGNSSNQSNKRQREHDDGTLMGDTASGEPPTFACHFYKKDPQKYNRRIRKYTNCHRPRIPHNDLRRRLKDHFKNHRLSQCDRCYIEFKNDRDLVAHRQLPDPCDIQPSTLKEGIDDGQWEKIVSTLRKNTDKGKSEFERWFEVWKILFPDTPPPQTPWSDPDILSTSQPTDLDAIIREIESSVEQGILPRNDDLYQTIYSVIRRALEPPMENSASALSTIPRVVMGSGDGSNIDPGLSSSLEGPIPDYFDVSIPINDINTFPNQRFTSQTSNTPRGQANTSGQSAGTIDFETSTNAASAFQFDSSISNAPFPEDWIDSLDVPYELTDPHPLLSSSGLFASDNSSFSIPDTLEPLENVIPQPIPAEYTNMDAFLAEDLPLLDIPTSQGIASEVAEGFETNNAAEIMDFLDTQHLPSNIEIDFLSTLLESEVDELWSIEPIQSNKDRNKGLKGRFEHDPEEETIPYP
ncbi:uncharacterized protein PAC_05650 [Phialocephala subalpina]|uniref:C2H2-type domain-containing protein n=1 Tax=Phialocephala subalpina TaxID=576137 RepID=A0A1L7WSL5_9HELO|nr:uncharacterized protein PAC_05650 [Phialocephala subalpina]